MMTLKRSQVEFIPSPHADSIFRLGRLECRVSGQGLWYIGKPRKYACTVHVGFDDDNGMAWDGSSLRIFVIPKGYRPEKVGLIYTDEGFVSDIKAFFKKLGMPALVDYSEQGMQGDNYVDMEVYSKRAVKWVKEQV